MSRDAGSVGPRVAAIDIGTNSVLLLVARVEPSGELCAIEERATITRLGEAVDKTRTLAPAAVERTLACLAEYAAAIKAHAVQAVDVVGTSAMRDAAGGEEFRARARELLGVEPRTISGSEEARLTFRGGLSGLKLTNESVVVFDIGGGSTELIAGEACSKQDDAVSLDIGSVRLTERHVRTDPPTASELQAIRTDVEQALQGAPRLSDIKELVGVAGTVTTLAAIAANIEPYDPARIHGAKLSRSELVRVCDLLASLPLVEREKLPGLSPKRADVIVAGAIICRAIVELADAAHIVVSDRGVRWGVAEELAASLAH